MQAQRQVFFSGECNPTRRRTKQALEVQVSKGVPGACSPGKIILKMRLSETAFHAFRRQYDKKTGSQQCT